MDLKTEVRFEFVGMNCWELMIFTKLFELHTLHEFEEPHISKLRLCFA